MLNKNISKRIENDNDISPANDVSIKEFEFFTVKRNWSKLFENNLKDLNTEKLIPNFPVNKPVPFDQAKMIKAIEYGMIILITYRGTTGKSKDNWKGGRERTIAPMVLGINKNTGNLLIRAFHLDGYSVSERHNTKKIWRLFNAANIKKMMFTGDFFRLPFRGYKMNDRVMTETTLARADFNKIRRNQFKLVQADKIQKAEETEITKSESALATQIQVNDTNTTLDLKKPWENQFMDKKKMREIKLTFMKSVFGDDFMVVFGALGTPGRTVKVFDNSKKLLGSYKTIQSFLASEIHYKKVIGGQSEYKVFTFVKKLN